MEVTGLFAYSLYLIGAFENFLLSIFTFCSDFAAVLLESSAM